MTAEVAIANAGAVALAADSAVTIGGQKIYNSALKLFSLSKVEPVGIMIYGNAGLMNVPWETLIKAYRKKLGEDCFETLLEYAEDFIEFLNGHPNAFPEKLQEDWLKIRTLGYYQFILEELKKELHSLFQKRGEASNQEVTQVFSELVKKHHASLSGKNYSEGMEEKDFNSVLRRYSNLFAELQEHVFEQIKIVDKNEKMLTEIGAYLQVKSIFSNDVSGLVIAGYGEAELYPSIITYEIEGVVENKLKYQKNQEKSHTINAGMECSIIAFAQEDMVKTFLQGINPSIERLLQGYLPELFGRLPELLSSEYTKTDEFSKKSSELLQGFFGELSKHIQDEHADPVLRMVTVLPKDELAAMAEALVNLTAFKRRITETMETVGGPIDVVVISKGDGLVWVKRKHYFPPELNQHFFKNYFRGISYGK